MGLIAAAAGAAGGVLADQYKEYFYCDSLTPDVLMAKGQKSTGGRSANTKGSENVITNGSVIAVNEGQAMAIVDQGKIVEFTAEAGAFTWEASSEPSIFTGDLAQGVLDTVARFADRFTFGGHTGKDQRVYFFNIKEITGNKYGTPTPVPFRVVDRNVGLDLDISVRCNGEYSYKVVDPLLFYINVAGNATESFTRSQLESQMRTELLSALQPAFAAISEKGVRYSAVPAHTAEICDLLDQQLSKKWTELRGIKIVSFGVNSIAASEEDQALIKNMQMAGALRDESMRAGTMAAATADAMRTAAGNEAGAMTGFMGMGFAGMAGAQMGAGMYSPNAGATQPANSYPVAADGGFGGAAQPQPQPQAQAAAQPAAATGWTCACGATSTGKFCGECGAPKPAAKGWTCACGSVNSGRFCPECGTPKPAAAATYRCSKCGWEPADPANPPRFCPECGDPFGAEDAVR